MPRKKKFPKKQGDNHLLIKEKKPITLLVEPEENETRQKAKDSALKTTDYMHPIQQPNNSQAQKTPISKAAQARHMHPRVLVTGRSRSKAPSSIPAMMRLDASPLEAFKAGDMTQRVVSIAFG